MILSRRQILVIIGLVLYWPFMFICTHIPISRIPLWVGFNISDKILHFVGYFALTFLLWFAVNPNKKVNWRKATVWWILFVVVWYGVIDEWLQGYVGRDPNVMDFFADLSGTLAGLIVLSFFPFWPASLAFTGAAIFVWTNLIKAGFAGEFAMNAVSHLLAYIFFTLLWIRYIHHFLPVKPPQVRWLIGALALPIGLLMAFELFAILAGNSFRLQNVIISGAGITAVIFVYFIMGHFRDKPQGDLPVV